MCPSRICNRASGSEGGGEVNLLNAASLGARMVHGPSDSSCWFSSGTSAIRLSSVVSVSEAAESRSRPANVGLAAVVVVATVVSVGATCSTSLIMWT